MSIFSKFFLKNRRANLFFAIRGYRKLLKNKKLKDVRFEHNQLHHTEIKSLSFNPILFSDFEENQISKEIILRQYILKYLVRRIYFNYLIKIGGKVDTSFCGPAEWINKKIYNKNKKIKLINKINFILFSFAMMIKSILLFMKISWINFTHIQKINNSNNTAYFFDLKEGCVTKNKKDDNIINWYINSKHKIKNLKIISSNLNVSNSEYLEGIEISTLGDPSHFVGLKYDFLKFIIIYICDLFLSLSYLFIGNFGNLILLPELVLYRSVQIMGKNNIAGHYLFRYTFSVYRPIWTYIAEKRGARISIYYYSMNADLKSPFGENDCSHAYFPMTWPEHMIWTKLLAKSILDYSVIKPKIFVENYIPFKSLNYKKINFRKKSIALFDVEPQRMSIYIKENGFGTQAEYKHYNKNFEQTFFLDILDLASKYGFTVYHKRKRIIHDQKKQTYLNFINKLESKTYFYSIDPNYDLKMLINNTTATISEVFTSVSYVAKLMGKNSIYYDPFNYIYKNDENRNGVTIVSGKSELEQWFKSI